jgi:hypothetical protein
MSCPLPYPPDAHPCPPAVHSFPRPGASMQVQTHSAQCVAPSSVGNGNKTVISHQPSQDRQSPAGSRQLAAVKVNDWQQKNNNKCQYQHNNKSWAHKFQPMMLFRPGPLRTWFYPVRTVKDIFTISVHASRHVRQLWWLMADEDVYRSLQFR